MADKWQEALHAMELQVVRMEARMEQEAKALQLQFHETMRRLHELNDAAHTRAVRDQDFVSKEMHGALESKLEAMAKELRATFEAQARQTSERFESMSSQFRLQHDATVTSLTDMGGQKLGWTTARDTTMRMLTIVVAIAALAVAMYFGIKTP